MPEVNEDERTRRREAALAWVNTKWTTSHQCPICRSNQWTVSDVYEWREFSGGDLYLMAGSPLFPAFGLVCQTCGYTFTFNAVVAGLIPGRPARDEGESNG